MPQDDNLLLAQERTALAHERNRLAIERTFLAWTRTGLASVAGGFAVIRFLTFYTFSHQLLAKIVGFILVFLGIWIFILSYLDFQTSYRRLGIEGKLAGSLWSTAFITIVLTLVSLAMLFIAFK